MIHYSIDTEPRRMIAFFLALIAVAISFGISLYPPLADSKWGTISVVSVFGLLFFTFDRWLWRYVPLIDVPDLNGTWTGSIERGVAPGETHGKPGSVTIHITQTWTRIDVVFRGTHSISRAEIAGLFLDNPKLIELKYGYSKRPSDGGSVNGVKDGYSSGYVHLEYKRDLGSRELKGRYFSDQFRGGAFVVTKVK